MDSRTYLLAGKARMSKEMRSFRVGDRWFTLKKDDTTGTGCNVFFDQDNAWIIGSKKPLLLHEDGVNMLHIMDAVVVWFVHYDEALRIMGVSE
jgi:hypothetical protein